MQTLKKCLYYLVSDQNFRNSSAIVQLIRQYTSHFITKLGVKLKLIKINHNGPIL